MIYVLLGYLACLFLFVIAWRRFMNICDPPNPRRQAAQATSFPPRKQTQGLQDKFSKLAGHLLLQTSMACYDSHYGHQSEQARRRAAAVSAALIVDESAQWNPSLGESGLISDTILF